MRVYRIEHEGSGDGPYNHNNIMTDVFAPNELREILMDAHGWNPAFPGWRDWYQDAVDYRHLAGFESMDDLLAWFDDEMLDIMHDQGFVVAEYEAEFAAAYCGHWYSTWDIEQDDYVSYIRRDGMHQVIFIGERLDTHPII